VLATFVAALGGFLLNRASADASDTGDLAQELSLQGSAAETSAYQQAESDYSQYLSLQSLKAKAAQEMLEATYDQADAPTWAGFTRWPACRRGSLPKRSPPTCAPTWPTVTRPQLSL